MTQKIAADVFRSAFKTIDKEKLNWFPGHMGRGLKQMQHKLRSVDCIIEVHDARIPLSGRNSEFKYTVSGVKPHILVLNKVDLIDQKLIPKITTRLKNEYNNIIFTNCKNRMCNGVKQVFPLAQKLIGQSDRYNRNEAEDFCMMVIGIPNVGKSSLINTLRNIHLKKANASQVGAVPGVTKSVLHKIKLSEKPLFYMLDTPGILAPSIPNTEVGLKLALCATIHDHLVGENIIADFLLYTLNKLKRFEYVKYFKLKEATDNILEVLTQICMNEKKLIKLKDVTGSYVHRPDFDLAAKIMLKAFRNRELGKIMLDEDML